MPAGDNWKIVTRAGSSDVEMKKSHFLGALRCCRTEEEAMAFVNEVRKEHRDARHHCFAMRIGSPDNVFERSSDDGEPQGTAGKPMLELLKGAGLYDVCAVVTRYFGGTLLGTGGLVRAYSDSLKEALAASETAELKKGCRVSMHCDYSLANRIQRHAANLGFYAMEENYGADCELVYLIPAGEAESFAARIFDMSAGSVTASLDGEVLYYGTQKPSVYRQETP